MITLEKIDAEIIKISDQDSLPDNLVAVAVLVDDSGVAYHSGLLIGVDQDYYLFHYTGENVLLDESPAADEWYFCKELEIVNGQDFSLSFLAHCEVIMLEEDPQYGFLFDGSYYDENGRHFTENGSTNFATCVGFCIKVITGFILNKAKYFELSDWDQTSVEGFENDHPRFINNFFELFFSQNPHISMEEFRQSYKRITPSEYTASAFLSRLPIRKSDIDKILENVRIVLETKRLSINET